jgi:hypothetical protein
MFCVLQQGTSRVANVLCFVIGTSRVANALCFAIRYFKSG